MKKLAILFLLATVLVSFSFAQVTVKSGLELANLNEGNDGNLIPALFFEFTGTSKTALGPGSIGASLGAGAKLYFEEDTYAYGTAGDNFIKGFYELPAGPGTLSFALSAWAFTAEIEGTSYTVGTSPLFGILKLNADYAGLAAGPATLGFGLEYAFRTSGLDKNGDTDGPFADGKGYKLKDELDLKVTAAFAFGLGIEYHFIYAFGKDSLDGDTDDGYIAEIAKLNVSYTLPSIPLKVGGELTGTGGWNTKDDEQAFFGGDGTGGFAFKPYAEYGISEKLTAGLELPIAGINADKPNDEITIGAVVYVKYAF